MELIKYKEEDLVLELDEGVNDPGIFKAIILAGGPGSGKSHVAKRLGLASMGLVVVNSDRYFEQLMRRKGLDLKMPESEAEERDAARKFAKSLTDKRLKSLIAGRLGILIDSTSGDQAKTFKLVRELKDWGYDVKAIFIDTDLDVALKRNKERARSVPDAVVKASHTAAQNVRTMMKKSLRRDYHEVTNNGGPVDISIAGKLTVWAGKPNESALEWLDAVRRGHLSVKTEDINTSTIKKFKEFTT